MSVLNVSDICTDADLANKVGGANNLDLINPDLAQRDRFRAEALGDVVSSLLSRSPPVSDADLADPSQLKDAIAYRALALLYRAAMTIAGDRNDSLSKSFQKDYLGAIGGRFTVSSGQTSPSGGTFAFGRR